MSDKNNLWWIRYLLVMIATLALGAALGELDLFQKTTVGALRQSAGSLVRFLGYGTTLLLLALLGVRAARELKTCGAWGAQASHFVPPLMAVIIVPAAQSVLLLLLGGLLSAEARRIYDWVFILGALGAAAWLVLSLYQRLEPLLDSLRMQDATDKEG